MAAIGDTAHPLVPDKAGAGDRAGAGDKARVLRLRILSALVLAPIALAAVWIGPPLLSALVVLAGAGMAWEWGRLCHRGKGGAALAILIGLVGASVTSAALDGYLLALILALAAALFWAASGQAGERLLAGIGVLWLTLPCIALLRLAAHSHGGRTTIFWILAVVWATDIGAFIVGRRVGGPRLAPRLSPNKTWSGLAGGVLCAGLAGVAAAALLGVPRVLWLGALSGALAVAAQFGDLAESMAKRHFGVKDSSNLIPGHGGLLDRLDGMLAVVPVVALLGLFGESNLLSWQ